MSDQWKPLTAERWRTGSAAGETAATSTPRPPNGAQKMLIELARGSMLKRGVFRAHVSAVVFALGGGRPIDVGFRNVTFRLEGGRNLIEYGILLNPAYNQQDIDFLEQGLGDGGVIVDIGCNIGLYGLPLARHAGPRSRLIAIDANPLMVERLRRNAALSGLGNVTAFACAVSDREGSGYLSVRKNDDAIVAVREAEDGPIPVRTLASLLAEAGVERIDGLKIDIEGHEDKALVPFLDQAPASLLPRRIVIEHSSDDEDYAGCTAAFARHGYELAGRSRNNSLYRLAVAGG